MIYLEADVWAPGKGKNDPYALAPVPQEQILLLGSPLSVCVFAFDRFVISKP